MSFTAECHSAEEIPGAASEGGDDGSVTSQQSVSGRKDFNLQQNLSLSRVCAHALALSIWMYGLSELKKIASSSEMSQLHDETKLEFPLTFTDLASSIAVNLDLLKQHTDASTYAVYLKTMDFAFCDSVNDDILFVAYDEGNTRTELVYCITLNPTKRQIAIGFRGSVTTHDFWIDSKTRLVPVPDPVEKGKTVSIHQGFRDYMYSSLNREGCSQRSSEAGEVRKIDDIIDRLLTLLEENPGFYVYCTGHSLGGSLATLLAWELAALNDDRIYFVTCITFASPKVGNVDFANSFRTLEDDGKLRCVRVTNHHDAIPKIPETGTRNPCGFTCLSDDYYYHHVGIHLTLLPDGEYKIKYYLKQQAKARMWLWTFIRRTRRKSDSILWRWMCVDTLMNNHSCGEYWNRLSMIDQLKLASLELLYQYRLEHTALSERAKAVSSVSLRVAAGALVRK